MKMHCLAALRLSDGSGFNTIVGTVVLSAILLYSSLLSADSINTVDINSADSKTLATELTGVGDSLSKAIIKERSLNGPFLSADDLQRVNGIGAAVVKKNRTKIVLGGKDDVRQSIGTADETASKVDEKNNQ